METPPGDIISKAICQTFYRKNPQRVRSDRDFALYEMGVLYMREYND
jgi:hypothetical protein